MLPGVNPRQLKHAMKQLGISQEDLEASEVLIKVNGKVLKFTNPNVQKVVMQGSTSFQITGEYVEEEDSFEINILEEDIDMVSEQAGVSKDEARKALDNSKGDIAQAILNLTNE